MRTLRWTFTLLFALLLCAIAAAQQPGELESMKLLTPEVGWTATAQRLFWTTNAGGDWKDITPKTSFPEEEIASAFFLDTSRGWVLLSHRAEPEPRFDLASTTNAGESWSITRLNVPDPDPARGLSGRAWIDFVDLLHGWVMVRMNGNTAVSIGVLLWTEDGGQTWKSSRQKGPPIAGPMRFVTAKEGWLAGGPDRELYFTGDGGENWQEVSLPAPPQVHLAAQPMPIYNLPIFQDGKHGYLQVAYSDVSNTASVLFATENGGQTWKPARILPEIGGASTIVNSAWIAASFSNHNRALTLTNAFLNGAGGEAGGVSADVSNFAGLHDVGGLHGGEEISFVERAHGWLLAGKLLSTSDGGVSWTDVTPPQLRPPKPSAPPVFVKVPRAALSTQPFLSRPATLAYPFPAPTDLSIHLGFDIYSVLSISDMQTWWDSSPYYDTGLYLPGSPNRHTDTRLDANWVAAIQQQGWGLIPIWFGLQAPCACGPDSTSTNCVPFAGTISSDTTTAKTQGSQEADAAITAVKNFEAAPNLYIALGTIIYHDIEIYTPSSTCSPPVKAFLGGWVSELHAKGYSAGVYANPSPIQSDVSKVSPLPDDIWVAKKDKRATIFGLGFSDALWADNQRMHQYQLDVFESYGGTPKFQIDSDIEDAQIAAGLGDKIYRGFAFDPVYYTLGVDTGYETIPQGINGAGKMVGAYYDSAGLVHGFQGTLGNYTSVDDPLATNGTVTYSINNRGWIVGAYGSNTVHGFLCQGGCKISTDFTTIDYYPNAIQTYTVGINDDSQIVGWYLDSSGIHGFQYNYGGDKKFSSFDGPGSAYTEAIGINGDTQIVGFYKDSSGKAHGFLYNSGSDGSLVTIDYVGALQTVFHGINNNGQITGLYQDSSQDWHAFLYNEQSGSFLTLPDYPYACSGCIGPVGLNDQAQIVGWYTATPGGRYSGFLATPQPAAAPSPP